MIKFVGHSLVDGAIDLDIYNVSNLVGFEIRAELDGSVVAEPAGKHVAGASAITERVRHSKR